MFEEVNDDLGDDNSKKADALTLEVLTAKIHKLTATIDQLEKAFKKKSDAEICRLNPGELLNFLNSQEVSYTLFHRWLINHQRNGLSFAHSLFERNLNNVNLSRQLLLLIRKLPQAECNKLLEQKSSKTHKTLEDHIVSFVQYQNKQLIEAYIDCLPAATTETIAGDEVRIRQYPRLSPYLITRLESICSPAQLLTFYQQNIEGSQTIGHYIDWNNDQPVAEYLRVLALFAIRDQVDILSALPSKEVISFQVIRLLNQLPASELTDCLSKINLFNQVRALFSYYYDSDDSDDSDYEDGSIDYYSKATQEDKNEFLTFLKRLTIDEQFNLLNHDANSTNCLLSRCVNNNMANEMLSIISGFSPATKLELLNSSVFPCYFTSDSSRTFNKRKHTLSYHLSEEKQSALITYLKEVEQLEPSSKLEVLARKVKDSDKSLNSLIEAACNSKTYPNVVVAYLRCLASTQSPISLTHANQQALIDVIKDLPEEQQITTCLLALKSGSALNNYLSIKVFLTGTGFFCMPCTKNPDIYLEQIQAMLPMQADTVSVTKTSEEQQQREPLMVDFREANDKNSTLQHRTGFNALI